MNELSSVTTTYVHTYTYIYTHTLHMYKHTHMYTHTHALHATIHTQLALITFRILYWEGRRRRREGSVMGGE